MPSGEIKRIPPEKTFLEIAAEQGIPTTAKEREIVIPEDPYLTPQALRKAYRRGKDIDRSSVVPPTPSRQRP